MTDMCLGQACLARSLKTKRGGRRSCFNSHLGNEVSLLPVGENLSWSRLVFLVFPLAPWEKPGARSELSSGPPSRLPGRSLPSPVRRPQVAGSWSCSEGLLGDDKACPLKPLFYFSRHRSHHFPHLAFRVSPFGQGLQVPLGVPFLIHLFFLLL